MGPILSLNGPSDQPGTIHSRFAFDWRLTLWLRSIAALAAFNVGLWIWIASSGALRTPYADTQLLLSAVYVGVCAFRSLYPRVDLERVCLWDAWLSAILLGRTAATIAELCFALQCAYTRGPEISIARSSPG